MNPKRIGLELYTERLVLRELDSTDASDAAFVLQLVNDPGFIKGIADVGVRDRAGASNYIERACETFFTRFGFGMYGVALRETHVDRFETAQRETHLEVVLRETSGETRTGSHGPVLSGETLLGTARETAHGTFHETPPETPPETARPSGETFQGATSRQTQRQAAEPRVGSAGVSRSRASTSQTRPQLIGLMGLLQRDTLDVPDLGFAFLSAHCRQGYAVEAGRAALFDARERVGLDRLVAITDHDNVASQATLHRLGFAYEREVALPPNKKPLMLFATHLSGRSLSAPSVKP